jgi:hypothetical protein
VHAAADAVGRLVDGRGDPLVLQRQRRVQPRDPGADDRDARGRRCRGRRGACEDRRPEGDAGGDGAAALQELAPRVGGLGPPLAQLGGGDLEPLSGVVLSSEARESAQKRCPCHRRPPSRFAVWRF